MYHSALQLILAWDAGVDVNAAAGVEMNIAANSAVAHIEWKLVWVFMNIEVQPYELITG